MIMRGSIKVRSRAAYHGLFLVMVFLSGCTLLGGQPRGPAPQIAEVAPPEPLKSEQTPPAHQHRKPNKAGKSYQVRGKTYRPLLTASGYEEKGIASWYGSSCHGHRTSCGEVFDMYKLSAAHKLLPMHTTINVTNLENGKSLTLSVNDRGPFIPGRVLDLSYAAAKSLSMAHKGLARILIRTIGPVEGQRANDLTGEFFVHVGSFEDETDALLLLEDMKSLGYKTSILKVVRASRDGEVRWRVEVGPYKSMSEADKAESKVMKDYPSAFVVAKE
jgi:rare lipoprotein A